MNQSWYIEKILSKLSMTDCKPRSTLCEMDIRKTSDEVDLIESKLYREIIGSLIWLKQDQVFVIQLLGCINTYLSQILSI